MHIKLNIHSMGPLSTQKEQINSCAFGSFTFISHFRLTYRIVYEHHPNTFNTTWIQLWLFQLDRVRTHPTACSRIWFNVYWIVYDGLYEKKNYTLKCQMNWHVYPEDWGPPYTLMAMRFASAWILSSAYRTTEIMLANYAYWMASIKELWLETNAS